MSESRLSRSLSESFEISFQVVWSQVRWGMMELSFHGLVRMTRLRNYSSQMRALLHFLIFSFRYIEYL